LKLFLVGFVFCDPVLTADSERERVAIYLMQSVERESNAMANTKGAAFEEKVRNVNMLSGDDDLYHRA
jgi:hypothetical protein